VQILECAAVIAMPAAPDDGSSVAPGLSSEEVTRIQQRLRNEFTKYFQRNYAAVAVRREAPSRGYLLCPWSDF
jgi:predicted GNAT superfamily acetyltransferase